MLGRCWEIRIFDKAIKKSIMARIKVLLKSKNNPAPIYIRLSDGRNVDVMAKTNYSINPSDWSSTKQEPKDLKDIHYANLNSELVALKSNLLKYYNKTNNNSPLPLLITSSHLHAHISMLRSACSHPYVSIPTQIYSLSTDNKTNNHSPLQDSMQMGKIESYQKIFFVEKWIVIKNYYHPHDPVGTLRLIFSCLHPPF